jgi:hypothetical protein
MRALTLLSLVLLAGCGEAVRDDHFAADRNVAAPADAPVPLEQPAVPVRIGELGSSFDACGTLGTTRNIAAGGTLAVRAAPFDAAQEDGGIAADARFFVCARSHDQKWLGVVFPQDGDLAACGVSSPVPARRDYAGPCESGWVPAPFVKLVAG